MAITLNGNGTVTGLSAGGISNANAVATAALPSGSVIQTKFAKSTASGTWQQSGLGNTASNWDDIPNLSLNITPSSSSSKILVLAHACGSEQTTAYGIWFRVMRDSTSLGGDVSASGTTSRVSVGFGMGCDNTYMDDQMGSASFSYMDEPATTSQLTYKVQGISRYSPHTWAYNRSYDSGDSGGNGQGVSTLTLLEIAA